jgi:hypothetical protein
VKTVKELQNAIKYHRDEIEELYFWIREAQRICTHKYIKDETTLHNKEICEYCEKIRWIT